MDDSFSGIHVLFSEEDENFLVGNSSLVSSNFLKDGKVAGHLGVIGPMRLDYKRLFRMLNISPIKSPKFFQLTTI